MSKSLVALSLVCLASASAHSQPRTPAEARAEFVEQSLIRAALLGVELPAGTTADSGGGGGRSGVQEYWRQRVTSNLAPEGLMLHYREQLRRNGWDPASSLGEPGVLVVQSFRFESEDGQPWRAILTIAKSSVAGELNVALEGFHLAEE